VRGHVRPYTYRKKEKDGSITVVTRRNVWQVVVCIGYEGTDKRGYPKPRYKWYTVQGSKGDAQKELTRLLHQQDTGTYFEPKKQSVGDYFEAWLKDTAPATMSPKQLEVCESYVRNHIIRALGNIPMAKLEPSHIDTFLSQAFQNGRRDGKGGLAPQTVNHLHGFLRTALQRAVDLKVIASNPCDSVRTYTVPRKEMLVLDEAQTARLLELVSERWLYLPILVAVTTGMRRGEIFGLKWDNLNLAAGTIHVQQALQETNAGCFLKEPKTGHSRRTITLPSITVEALRRHKGEQAALRLSVGPKKYQDRGMVFAQSNGDFIRLESFTEMFRTLIRRSDLPKVRFHDLRHSHVSQLIKAGENVKVVSERLGHANVAMTLNTYAHLFSGADQQAAGKIDAILRAAIGERTRKDV
jgi:integrase